MGCGTWRFRERKGKVTRWAASPGRPKSQILYCNKLGHLPLMSTGGRQGKGTHGWRGAREEPVYTYVCIIHQVSQ